MQQGLCLAMWSGPRNISTAMMRAWENRADTQVVDEPFYAHYLQRTGIEHPMREAIIAAGDTDVSRIIKRLSQPLANGIFYQKHITVHWMPDFPDAWLASLSHAFLIRDPRRVVASYAHKREQVATADIGFARQGWLFDRVRALTGLVPPIIDCDRFLAAPEAHLRWLCTSLGVRFDDAMLAWPAGERDSDGVWQTHWYDAVKRSTGFAPPPGPMAGLSGDQARIAGECQPEYQRLLALAFNPATTRQ